MSDYENPYHCICLLSTSVPVSPFPDSIYFPLPTFKGKSTGGKVAPLLLFLLLLMPTASPPFNWGLFPFIPQSHNFSGISIYGSDTLTRTQRLFSPAHPFSLGWGDEAGAKEKPEGSTVPRDFPVLLFVISDRFEELSVVVATSVPPSLHPPCLRD